MMTKKNISWVGGLCCYFSDKNQSLQIMVWLHTDTDFLSITYYEILISYKQRTSSSGCHRLTRIKNGFKDERKSSFQLLTRGLDQLSEAQLGRIITCMVDMPMNICFLMNIDSKGKLIDLIDSRLPHSKLLL